MFFYISFRFGFFGIYTRLSYRKNQSLINLVRTTASVWRFSRILAINQYLFRKNQSTNNRTLCRAPRLLVSGCLSLNLLSFKTVYLGAMINICPTGPGTLRRIKMKTKCQVHHKTRSYLLTTQTYPMTQLYKVVLVTKTKTLLIWVAISLLRHLLSSLINRSLFET